TVQGRAEVRAPAHSLVRRGERRETVGIPADEQQIGQQPIAIAQLQTALVGDRQEVRHVLGRAHASRRTVDDDAYAAVGHGGLLLQLRWWAPGADAARWPPLVLAAVRLERALPLAERADTEVARARKRRSAQIHGLGARYGPPSLMVGVLTRG